MSIEIPNKILALAHVNKGGEGRFAGCKLNGLTGPAEWELELERDVFDLSDPAFSLVMWTCTAELPAPGAFVDFTPTGPRTGTVRLRASTSTTVVSNPGTATVLESIDVVKTSGFARDAYTSPVTSNAINVVESVNFAGETTTPALVLAPPISGGSLTQTPTDAVTQIDSSTAQAVTSWDETEVLAPSTPELFGWSIVFFQFPST